MPVQRLVDASVWVAIAVGVGAESGVGVRGGVTVGVGGSGVRDRSGSVRDGSSGDESRVFPDNSVETFSAGSVVDSPPGSVGFQEGVLALHVVVGAALHLALEVTGVGVSHAVGKAVVVVGESDGQYGEKNDELEKKRLV